MKKITLFFCLFYSSVNAQTGKILQPINEALQNKIGLELYSVRHELQKDVRGTLQKVKAMGINEVEVSGFFGYTPEDFKKALEDAGLKPTSMLCSYEQLRDSLDVMIQRCKLFGIHYLGTAWIPHDKSFTREEAVSAANLFNIDTTSSMHYHWHTIQHHPYHH